MEQEEEEKRVEFELEFELIIPDYDWAMGPVGRVRGLSSDRLVAVGGWGMASGMGRSQGKGGVA